MIHKKLLFPGFLASILIILLSLIVFPSSRKFLLISPLTAGEKFASNLWIPQALANDFYTDAPEVNAISAYFVDADTGVVLFQKNPHQRVPIASLTKIMTVIVALENKKFTDALQVSNQAAQMEPDHMQLIAGERLTVEELLSGIFLVSANDAAEVFAEDTFADRKKFINTMNLQARELGMNDTLFINPTGLQEDGVNQYSSAFDVALMSRFAIKNFPHLLDISSNPHVVIPKTSTHQDYEMYSGINLLTTYPGVMGFKTGYTPEAGLTLVTFAQVGNHRVLGVILNSDDRREEAKKLLDYSFKKLGMK